MLKLWLSQFKMYWFSSGGILELLIKSDPKQFQGSNLKLSGLGMEK